MNFIEYKTDNQIRITDFVNPKLEAKKIEWSYYMDSYLGGKSYKKREYLYRPSWELEQDFCDRLHYTDYVNYCKRAIDNYVIPIHSKTIKRTGIDTIINNCNFYDLNGNKIDIYMFNQERMRFQYIYGEIFIRFDYPKIEEGLTKLQVKNLNLDKIFVELISPSCIVDYKMDYNGLIDYIIIKNYDKKSQNDFYYVWNLNKVYIFSSNDKLVDEIETSFPTVPFIRLILSYDKDGFGQGLVENIADTNKDLFNINSLIWKTANQDVFSPMFLPISTETLGFYQQFWGTVTNNSNLDTTPTQQNNRINFSLKDIMVYDASGNSKPMFLEKNQGIFDKLENIKNQKKNDLDIITNQFLQRVFAFNQSGISKAYDSQSNSNTLTSIAKIEESMEKKIYTFMDNLFDEITLDNDFDVVYDKDFDIYNKELIINNTIKLIDPKLFGISPTFKQEAFKQIDRYLYENKIENVDKILEELGQPIQTEESSNMENENTNKEKENIENNENDNE